MPLELQNLSATELKSLSAAKTVFFFPVGALEDHGPHLPLGLDLEEARALCRLAAEKLEAELPEWTGVLMPTAPLGVESNTTHIALTVRSYVLRDWLIDACKALKKIGFKHFVCFSGHLGPRQLTAIEDAAKIISRRPLRSLIYPMRSATTRTHVKDPYITLVSACSALVTAQEARRSPLWPDVPEHGGKTDTSIALALKPELVDSSSGALIEVTRPDGRLNRLWLRIRRKTQNYWGTPAHATADHGQKVLIGHINEIFPKLRAVWEGSNPDFLFRSWYSILPPNKSFAKGWLMGLTLIALIWAYLNLGGYFAGL
jgi:creatinine amidohydrolase